MIQDFSHCQHPAERKVFEFLSKNLPNTTDIVVFPNIELFDASKASYLECDAIVLAKSFIAVVELKDWFGTITVHEPKWRRGTKIIDSPHIVNNRKCKVFKSYLQHVLSGIAEHNLPFVQSLVALTNEEAKVDGASSARHANCSDGTVTLDGVDELVQYLKRCMNQKEQPGRTLSDYHFRRIVEQLNKDKQSVSVGYEDQIPGYRIREDYGSSPTYISYIAERTPNIDNRLYRLRVFGELSNDQSIRESQLRSLRSAAALPNHPGIRSVSAHANSRQLIVEVSDWTDTRSLDDLLCEHEVLDWRRIASIVRDIALALDCIHTSSAALVHRNIQPSSLLIGTDGHAQLTDFNLAYDPGANFTVLGTNFETHLSMAYSAPELLLGRPDFKSDIFSLGAVFLRGLSGKEPSTNIDIDRLVKELPGCTPEEQRQLHDLIRRMLEKTPLSRLAAHEVVAAIDSLIDPPQEYASTMSNAMTDTLAYSSMDLIAEGATAQIYKVDNLGEHFVHKVFNKNVPRNQALLERDMLRAVDALDLPVFFPRVRHFSEVTGDRWCLATDLVPGQSLRSLIDAGTRPTMEQFIKVSKVMLEALACLHGTKDENAEGIIHNDINPNNILFDAQSDAVGLIDFGCASAPGVVGLRGTPGYVNPFLISRGEMNACPQGDLYALAITLGQWLRGDGGQNEDDQNEVNSESARVSLWLREATKADGCSYPTADAMSNELEKTLTVAAVSNSTEHAEIVVEHSAQRQLTLEALGAETIQSQNDATSISLHLVNPFVSYLNTLHNVSAGNANALAEYQSTNKYFASIYEPSKMAQNIYEKLTSETEVVIVLSGHAGDGKSTVALEVLKQLRKIAPELALTQPPVPHEEVFPNGKRISILKDMSEHTADNRLSRFSEAIVAGSGSWLIVSNTGPLLNTLSELRGEIEEKILGLLDQPINGQLDDSVHRIDDFDKPIYIANLSKLDNVETAVNVLKKISSHQSWNTCDQCSAKAVCPIRKNVIAIQHAPQLTERVSWLYRLLTAYERRLTMRQMTAHLAYSVTGGTMCSEVQGLVSQVGPEVAIRRHLFSELFFGFSDRKALVQTSSLFCVEQLRSHVASERTRPAVELKLQTESLRSFAPISSHIQPVFDHWRDALPKGAEGGLTRSAIRRLIFMFGARQDEHWWGHFVEDFTGSAALQDWDIWRQKDALPTSPVTRRNLVRQILAVLSEHCIGGTRTSSINDKLYITLRRDDMETTQPVQVVIGEYDENDFKIDFNVREKMPRLIYGDPFAGVFMRLPLPLLDFVRRRSVGDFGQDLDPIHINQLDLFCSKLVAKKRLPADDIRLLSIGITGEQNVFRVSIDSSIMEIH